MSDQVPSSDEEISLFDLFLVLVRQRKILFLFNSICLLLIAAIYIILPPIKLSRIEKYRTAKELNSYADCVVMLPYRLSPNITNLVSDVELDKIVQNVITDPDFLIKVFSDAGYTKVAGIDLSGDLEAAQKRFKIYQYFTLKKSLTGQSVKDDDVLLENKKTSSGYQLSLRTFDSEMAKSVLEAIFSEVERYADIVIRPLALKAVDDYEEILTSISPSQLVQANMIAQYPRYSSARSYLNRTDTPYSRFAEVQIISKPLDVKSIRDGLTQKMVLLMIASIFLSLITTFVVDFVQSIVSDENAMARFRRAMERKR